MNFCVCVYNSASYYKLLQATIATNDAAFLNSGRES